MDNKITKFSNELALIPLLPPIAGFDKFISTWVYQGEKTFIVDVGPAVTTKNLIAALKGLGIKELDYILLTHIHIDHAGGIGEIAECFPEAEIVCHPKGIPHLVDPEKLIKGSIKTLGETGRIYGPIRPVDHSRFIEADNFSSEYVQSIITPGHAPHHVSFITGDYLFVGETGGVHLSTEAGTEYLRPATPPRFFLETAIESIDKLIELRPKAICYGHFGMEPNAIDMLKSHKDQLHLWHDEIKKHVNESDEKNYYETVTSKLFEVDPLLEGFHALADDVKEREKGFIKNAIMGFTGYIKDK